MSHLTRYYMYKRIGKFVAPIQGKVLCVSGIGQFSSFIDKRAEIVETKYPEVDIHNLPYPDQMFDYVISDQVLEHVKDPERAVSESYRVLKTGGIAIHTTCFLNYYHPDPLDYWRFSPDALSYLCRNFSKIIVSEGWGNRMVLLLCFLSDRYRFMHIPESKYSLRNKLANWNEQRYPITTWVIAQK